MAAETRLERRVIRPAHLSSECCSLPPATPRGEECLMMLRFDYRRRYPTLIGFSFLGWDFFQSVCPRANSATGDLRHCIVYCCAFLLSSLDRPEPQLRVLIRWRLPTPQ
jgi:hypothetical protein